MEFFLMIFPAFIFSISRAEEKGSWNMDHPIYKLTGDTFYLRYTTKDDLYHCSFTTPDDIKLDLFPEIKNVSTTGKRPSDWTWNRYWKNNRTDCGIQINRATVNDSGPWEVLAVTTNADSYRNTTTVTILPLDAPDRVILEPNIIGPIYMRPGSVSKRINISCTAYKSRGNVTLTWWIGENQLFRHITDYKITNNTDQDKNLLYKDVSQVFQYFPVPSHDSKQLKCIANHSAYTKEDLANETNIAAIDITIKAPPVPNEKDTVFKNYPMGNLSIDIPFHANPPPQSIYWKMHDMKKQLGYKEGYNQTSGRYTALRNISSGNGNYIATISISNLSESDGDLQNILLVKNEIGNTSYTFTFKFDDNQVSGLKVGEIAGIVLGCLGAACLIYLVASQLGKRKSTEITPEGAENREEMRETSRTQPQED